MSEAWNFIKKETLAQVFSCEFCKIFKNTFLRNYSGRLFLMIELALAFKYYIRRFKSLKRF